MGQIQFFQQSHLQVVVWVVTIQQDLEEMVVLVVEQEVVTVLQVLEHQAILPQQHHRKETQEEVHLEVHLIQVLVEVVEQALQEATHQV